MKFPKFFASDDAGERGAGYTEAKKKASDKDVAVRRELAARTDVNSEILYFLATDAEPEVRRAIARNEATPYQADMVLARDQDSDIRHALAGKISRLAPQLSHQAQDKVRDSAIAALEILAQDQITRVRQVIAETLKDVADAPADVIRRLARDAETVVAGPVLQFSPILTDADLLEIIKSPPASGSLSAISNRTGVTGAVADALVATDDVDAIQFLLVNHSAQIREETLDHVIARAVDVEAWHGPLVDRPKLSPGAAGRIARFVADDLLGRLQERDELGSEALQAVREEVHKRLDHNTDDAALMAEARDLHAAGQLGEQSLVASLPSEKPAVTMASLAVLSELPLSVVRKTMETQSAKGVVAIAWKAGLSAAAAEQIQRHVARISQSNRIAPLDGGYALEVSDLEWQISFIQGL